MNRRRFSTIILALLMGIISAQAQENTPRQIYEQAEAEYQIGRILIAKNMLQGCVHNLSSTYRLGGYRLLSLCCLALDDFEGARMYAELVLKENPYYTPTVEYPPRFIDLINEIKQGATITTASSQSENINEAPVPITIITAEMIEELGNNKNLNQILAAYVPGMVEMTSDDAGESLSTHGAYGDGQELVMILENGQRLNNRYNNAGQTSYAISTEKIDHIEVLRGPSSSLYGNVALTAVVNIITKSGRSINGVKAKYGYGTFNTHRGDLLIGTHFMDTDISAWASVYASDGQVHSFNDGKGYLSGQNISTVPYDDVTYRMFGPDALYTWRYKNAPCYDVGATFNQKDFRFMLTRKRNNKAAVDASVGSYDINRYHTINGIKPGHALEETHASINYTHMFKKWFLDASVYCDWYNYNDYNVISDSIDVINNETGKIIPEMMREEQNGIYMFYNDRENSFGGILKASTNYQFGHMKGNLLAGAQYDHFSFHSRLNISGYYYDYIDGSSNYFSNLIDKGEESYLSFFVQDKHYFMPQLILNAGFRIDFKNRKDEDVLNTFSPRLALMYVPNELFSLKLSYSEAFSDLSYKNRYFYNSEYYTMDPQHLSAVQLTAMGRIAPAHINYEVNLFYNNYSNLFCSQIRHLFNEEIENTFQNKGHLENIGIETSASYSHNRLSANLTFYYCHNLYSKDYYYNSKEKKVHNVPHLTCNLHGSWKLVQSKNHELKIYGNAYFTDRTLVYKNTKADEDYYTDSQCIFDLGMKYGYRQRLTLSVDIENILNTDNYLCGNYHNNAPIFLRSRNVMGTLSYTF